MLMNLAYRLFIFLVVCIGHVLSADNMAMPAKITLQVPTGSPNEPIQAGISITHLAWQQVNDATFTVDGQPLSVTKIGDTTPAGKATLDANTLILSQYTFSIPAKPRGLYLFPPVQVKVGDSYIASSPVSFEVAGSQFSDEIHLDARVAEKGPFYPGQKVTFQYLITFNKPIQLTREKLPLLEFPGFRTVGAPKIDNLSQGSNTVQTISQQAIALEPGTFSSGPSLIEGYIYGQDAYGNKQVSQTLLQAQAPNIQVVVLDFPKQGMPVSFNGAIGDFYWKVKAVGSTNIAVGEKITLEVVVSGSGEYDTVYFPDLSLQKGFKDVFRLSDLAPVGEMKDGSKRFVVNMRPIVSGVKLIPSIEFSSFEPISKTYVVKRSDPIVISVRPGKSSEREEPNMQGMPPAVWPIEVQGNFPLNPTELQGQHLQDILLVYAALFMTAALAAQHMFKRLWLDSQKKGVQSRDIILDAIKQKSDPDACCKLLRKALLLRLFEVGITPKLAETPEELSSDGLQGEIRTLLVSIEQKRFMGLETQLEIKEIINEASQLYYRMK